MKLYGYRNVINNEEIIEYFRKQGVEDLVDPKSLHVTVIYSKKDVDEKSIKVDNNSLYYIPENTHLEKFGDYLVMVVNSPYLQDRFKYFESKGCSYDYPKYKPHISLCENFTGNIETLTPFKKPIFLTKEKIEELNEEWEESDNLD